MAPVDVQADQGQAALVELTSEPNADAELNAAQPLPEKADTRPKEPNFLVVPVVQSKEDSDTSKQSKKFYRREHGKGIERPVQDPRNGQDNYNRHLAGLIGRGKVPFHYRLESVSLPYNEYSCGPPPRPPPSAILVTNLSRLVTAAKIQAHFSQYGTIHECDYKTDPATGGFLGICWVKYEDSTKRNVYDRSGQIRTTGTEGGQDGNLCAREAAKRNNGHKHPILAGKDDKLRVLVDGEGIFCARLVKEALDLKYGRLKPKMSSDARLQKPEPPLVPHKSLPSRPRTERSPEPAYESDASRSRRPPTQSRRDDSDHRLKGDSYRPRTPPRGPSHARDYAQTSPPNTSGARAPYRLPTSTTRRSPERSRHGPKLSVSRANDSDSDSANASDSEENSRWKDDDRVYGVDSRLPRRQAPVAAVKAVLLSEKDRLHISALRMLADQDYQYLVIEKGNVRAENFRITDHTIKSHLAGHQPKDVCSHDETMLALF